MKCIGLFTHFTCKKFHKVEFQCLTKHEKDHTKRLGCFSFYLEFEELYSFIHTMLWLSLSSLLPLAKYFYQYASILWPGRHCHAAMLRMRRINVWPKTMKKKETIVVSLNEYVSL